MGSESALIEGAHEVATSIQAVRPDSISPTGITTRLAALRSIVFQQAALPFPTAHLFLFSSDCWSPQGEQQEVVFALVAPSSFFQRYPLNGRASMPLSGGR